MGGFALVAIFFFLVVAMFAIIHSLSVRLGSWGRAYHKLAGRYSARVLFSRGRPRMTFKYGAADSVLKNKGSRLRNSQKTQLFVQWPDRKLKWFGSSLGNPTGILTAWNLNRITIDSASNEGFVVFSNQPVVARRLITPTNEWQIRQLDRHVGQTGIEIFIHFGQMRISKPGHIKDAQQLDDFVRFGLELFDQFKLAISQDIEFVAEGDPVVVSEVTCPICSEQIQEEMVVCVRCRTPHCADCWEYNGQCATFACCETRFFRAGGGEVASVV